jgi:hypothetical protein
VNTRRNQAEAVTRQLAEPALTEITAAEAEIAFDVLAAVT